MRYIGGPSAPHARPTAPGFPVSRQAGDAFRRSEQRAQENRDDSLPLSSRAPQATMRHQRLTRRRTTSGWLDMSVLGNEPLASHMAEPGCCGALHRCRIGLLYRHGVGRGMAGPAPLIQRCRPGADAVAPAARQPQSAVGGRSLPWPAPHRLSTQRSAQEDTLCRLHSDPNGYGTGPRIAERCGALCETHAFRRRCGGDQ